MNTQICFRRCIPMLLAIIVPVSMLFFSCQKKESTSKTDESAGKKWKISIVKYEEIQQTEETQQGIIAGLRDAGIVEGKDYELKVRNAQGDMATVLNLIDAAVADKSDMIISLQTPTLHAAVARGGTTPIVFMVIANPFVIKDMGTSDSTHMPNVTGVYTQSTFDKMLSYIRECIPNVKKIGTLYARAELNATFYKESLKEAAVKTGLELETIGVTTRLEVPEAALALCSKGIDAVCQIEDNLTSATFSSIIQAAHKSKVPVFSFVKAQADMGAVLTIAPDYYLGATDAAFVIAKIMKGANPKDIPFQRIKKFPVILNTRAAETYNLSIPPHIKEQADQVIYK